MAKQKKTSSRSAILGRVLRYIGRYRLLLAVSLTLAIATAVGTLFIPLLVGYAIDEMVEGGMGLSAAVFDDLSLIGILVLGTALLQWLLNVCNNRLAYQVVRDVRRDAFGRIQRLPLSYLDAHPTGDLVSRVIGDADSLADGLLLGFTQLFTGVVTIVGTLVIMATVHWVMMLVVVVLTPLSLFVAKFIATRTYGFSKAQTVDKGAETAYLNEAVGDVKTLKAFGQEAAAQDRFASLNATLEKSSLLAGFFSSLTNPTTRFVNNLVYAAVALVGCLLAIGGVTVPLAAAFTVGMLSSFLAYANQYTKPFNEISGVVAELQNAIACAGRLLELIEAPAEESDEGRAILPDAKGAVRLEDVSFSYVPEKPLIEHFDLDVKPGMRIAIVGPTGCGKTTLINLLMRFYDVKEGKISVDGMDIREVTRHSLRHNYGMVLQETWLSPGTVAENIAMGRPDATREEIVKAAKDAHAHSFIRRLPEGYDTVLGESGGGLSQGQRQLLCIARIMLTMPPMLILDEATSSIDTRTEEKIQSAFGRLMEGKTSFIVAHRLSTVRGADRILAMRDGHVVETGTHEELLRRGGFYADLYQSQFET